MYVHMATWAIHYLVQSMHILFLCSLHPNIDFYIVPEKRLLRPADSNAAVHFFTASCSSIGSYGRLLDSQQNLFLL